MSRATLFLTALFALLLSACSNPTGTAPEPEKVLFRGCPTVSQVDDFSADKASLVYPTAVTSDNGTQVWVAGQIQKPGEPLRGLVRMSSDSGVTWKTIDESLAANSSMVFDSNGVLLVGQTLSSNGLNRASIRYSKDMGLTWFDAPVAFSTSGSESIVSASLENGKALFVGTSEDKAQKRAFYVTFENDKAVLVNGDTPVEKKALFVASEASASSGWKIKKTSDGGKTADDLAPFESPLFKTLSLQTLYYLGASPIAVGGGVDTEGQSHWIIRFANTPSGRWQTYSFLMSKDPNVIVKASAATGIAGSTELIVVGDSYDSDSGHHWVAKKIAACLPPPKP